MFILVRTELPNTWSFVSVFGKISDELAHSRVIEQYRNSANPDVDRYPVPNDQGVSIVDFKSVSVDQRDGKRLKGDSVFQGLQGLVTVNGLHG